MFQNLLGEIRAAVIGRIYLYQPRAMTAAVEAAAGSGAASAAAPAPAVSVSKKKKRHRH